MPRWNPERRGVQCRTVKPRIDPCEYIRIMLGLAPEHDPVNGFEVSGRGIKIPDPAVQDDL